MKNEMKNGLMPTTENIKYLNPVQKMIYYVVQFISAWVSVSMIKRIADIMSGSQAILRGPFKNSPSGMALVLIIMVIATFIIATLPTRIANFVGAKNNESNK